MPTAWHSCRSDGSPTDRMREKRIPVKWGVIHGYRENKRLFKVDYRGVYYTRVNIIHRIWQEILICSRLHHSTDETNFSKDFSVIVTRPLNVSNLTPQDKRETGPHCNLEVVPLVLVIGSEVRWFKDFRGGCAVTGKARPASHIFETCLSQSSIWQWW